MKKSGQVIYDAKWWQHAVVYRADIGNFCDSDDENDIGDIEGLTNKLDYIADLSVDVVWLPSLFLKAGGEVLDYKHINPDYGTVKDMQCLAIAADARGLAVVISLDDISPSQLDEVCEYWRKIGVRGFSYGIRNTVNNAVSTVMTIDGGEPILLSNLTLSKHMCRGRRVKSLRRVLASGVMSNSRGIKCAELVTGERLASYCAKPELCDKLSRLVMTVAATLPGTPCIGQGQELSMTGNVNEAISWDDVLRMEDEHQSPLSYSRRIWAMRKSSLLLQDGTVQLIEDKSKVLCYLRNLGDESVIVVANVSAKKVRPRLKMTGKLLVSNYSDREDLSEPVLRPYEVVVMKV